MTDRMAKRLPAFFYRSHSGHEPVREWLKEQSTEDRRAIGIAIAKVEFGWPVGMPVCRPMAPHRGLWEIRCSVSDARIARILFCIHSQRLVLLHAFVKKSQKTPDREIDLALKRKQETER
jgi:phage-related protein